MDKNLSSKDKQELINFTPITREIKVSRVDEKTFKHLMKVWHAVFTPYGVKNSASF